MIFIARTFGYIIFSVRIKALKREGGLNPPQPPLL